MSSSTAQESMLKLIAAHSSGVLLLTAQLTKCDGVFSNSKRSGILEWRVLSMCHPVAKAWKNKEKMRKYPIFSVTRPCSLPKNFFNMVQGFEKYKYIFGPFLYYPCKSNLNLKFR